MKAGARVIALASWFVAITGCTGEDTVLNLLPAPKPPDAGPAPEPPDAGPDSGPAPPAPMHCMTSADCKDPMDAVCRLSDQVCVACLVDTDCTAGDTCDAGAGECVPGP